MVSEFRGASILFDDKPYNFFISIAKELIEAIQSSEVLEFLNLEGNTLGVDAARGIGDALKKHPEFKRALFKDLFTGRMKTEIPLALKHLGRGMIEAGAQITVLDCSDNALGPNGMVGLVDLIKSSACYSLQVGAVHHIFHFVDVAVNSFKR